MAGVAGAADEDYVEFEVPSDTWWDSASRIPKARKTKTVSRVSKGSDVADAPKPRKGRTVAKAAKQPAAPKASPRKRVKA